MKNPSYETEPDEAEFYWVRFERRCSLTQQRRKDCHTSTSGLSRPRTLHSLTLPIVSLPGRSPFFEKLATPPQTPITSPNPRKIPTSPAQRANKSRRRTQRKMSQLSRAQTNSAATRMTNPLKIPLRPRIDAPFATTQCLEQVVTCCSTVKSNAILCDCRSLLLIVFCSKCSVFERARATVPQLGKAVTCSQAKSGSISMGCSRNRTPHQQTLCYARKKCESRRNALHSMSRRSMDCCAHSGLPRCDFHHLALRGAHVVELAVLIDDCCPGDFVNSNPTRATLFRGARDGCYHDPRWRLRTWLAL